jgi:hypothetical protein
MYCMSCNVVEDVCKRNYYLLYVVYVCIFILLKIKSIFYLIFNCLCDKYYKNLNILFFDIVEFVLEYVGVCICVFVFVVVFVVVQK